LTRLIAKRALVMGDLLQIDIISEVRPDSRIKRMDMVEVQLKIPGEFANSASDIECDPKVLYKWFAEQIR
jgi:hypothetical protein